jgi:hypothetical protein
MRRECLQHPCCTPMRRHFSLIELLTVMAIGFAAAAAMVTVVHNSTLFVRRANQGVWANQQMQLFRAAWRHWAAETKAASWQSDGSSFSADTQKAEVANGQLVLTGTERTRRLALPKDAQIAFALEKSLGLAPLAVLEISWPVYGSRTEEREQVRIVFAESAE